MSTFECQRGFAAPRLAPTLSISDGAAVDFDELRVFPGALFGTSHDLQLPRLVVHYRLYIALAALSARVHPARLPRASSRLARAKVAANFACARSSARLIEPGVGWRSICAPIDCAAIGPAFGLPDDCRTASSNCAIWSVQGPACAGATLRLKTAVNNTAANRRFIILLRRSIFRADGRVRWPTVASGYRDGGVLCTEIGARCREQCFHSAAIPVAISACSREGSQVRRRNAKIISPAP